MENKTDPGNGKLTAPTTNLSWANIGLGFSFILFNSLLSAFFRLGIEKSLFIAAVRCVLQLSVVAVLLQQVFAARNPWAVAGIALVLNLLGTFEIVATKSKRRYSYMYPSILTAFLGSTIPISVIGSRFAMSVKPFWEPIQYIPIVGMLCGNVISGIVICVSHVLRELEENSDKIEMRLAFGASRMEACKPIAREALVLALMPVINQMSVIGIIAIPGMMTGAILGGSSVEQAARLQMIIMFMISSSTALASIFSTIAVIAITVDSEHRIRNDRIDDRKFILWRASEWLWKKFIDNAVGWFNGRKKGEKSEEDEELASFLPD